MTNRWNIPKSLEDEVLARDSSCIYCGVAFGSTNDHGNRPTWEHIINDEQIITRENIARCCRACNSSKGTKPLPNWIESTYCKRRGITREKVAEIVKLALQAAQ
jgi:5-methylcytosine-specific restriction endonuclease McrA